MILIDSNLIVAALVDHHIHNEETLSLLDAFPRSAIMVAAHSFSEAFVTLTRHGGAVYAFDPARVRTGLAVIRSTSTLVAMTAEQTIDAIERFADIGIGARLYDYLIGRTGMLHGAEAIVTFNTGHMRALFPGVTVATPGEWLALNPAPPPPP